MLKLEIKEGTPVFTSNGKEVGKVNRFVLNPETDEVTHIVVEKGWLLPEDKVVPFEMIDSASEDKIVLKKDIDDFDQLPSFEETRFVRANGGEGIPVTGGRTYYAPAYYWYPPPNGYIGYPAYGLPYPTWPPTVTQQNIPENTVPLKDGSNVISSDGKHVGDVERLFIEPDSHKVTHFLISQGLLFKDHKVVPTNWVKSVEENKVNLTVSSKLLEDLPPSQT